MILKENRLPLLNRADNPEADQENPNLDTSFSETEDAGATGLVGDVSTGIAKTDSIKDIFVKFNTMFLKKFDSLDATLQKINTKMDHEKRNDSTSVKKGLEDVNKNLSSLIKDGDKDKNNSLIQSMIGMIANNPAAAALTAIAGGVAITSIFGAKGWKELIMQPGSPVEFRPKPINFGKPGSLWEFRTRGQDDNAGVNPDDGKVHISGSDNAEKAMDYFQKRGYSKIESAGIVGNLQAESGLDINPKAVGDQGLAYGAAQWHPERQKRFREQFGHDIRKSNFMEQLAFIDWEFKNTHRAAREELRNARTVGAATTTVMKRYEIPRDATSLSNRRDFAADAYKKSIENEKTKVDLPAPVLKKQEGFLDKAEKAILGPWASSQAEVKVPESYKKLEQTIERDDLINGVKRDIKMAQLTQSQSQNQITPQVTTIDNTSTTIVTKIDPIPKDETYHRGVSLTGSYEAFRV